MSREKLNIQFRIRAVDNFSKTMNKLHTRLEGVKRHVDSIDNNQEIEINVTGDQKAKKDIRQVDRAVDRLQRKNVFIQIKTNHAEAWKGFRGLMGKIAHLSRDASELFTSMFGSAIMASAPALASSLKAILAVAGSLGPMIGALSGGVLGLASAFSAAGIGAAGFGALAVTSLSKVFSANSELNDLQKELDDASDAEERLEIMKEMEAVMGGLNAGQKRALKSIQSLSSAWKTLSDRVEPKVIDTFVNSMSALESVLVSLTPMFEAVADEAVKLSKSLEFNVKSKDFRAFIDYLNTSAAPIMSDIIKGLGNFAMGVINVLTAFGPLAEVTAKGFNNMGREFREWAAGLSESEKFQAFVDYVKEEAPKLLSIFGGIVLGLTDMFAAFGPLASEMLDGLLAMVEGFKEWAATLDENPAFQEFVQYIRDNGPMILEFFGELRQFLFNVVEGFAAASEHVTPFLTNMLELANTFMEANPWFMEFVGILTAFLGIAMLIIVPLRLMWTALKILLNPIIELVRWIGKNLTPVFQRLYTVWVNRVLPTLSRLWQWFLRALPTLARVGGAFLRFISGPVGWITAAVVGLGTIIYQNWDAIWTWTKDTWGKIKEWIAKKVAQIAAVGAVIWGFIKGVIGYFADLWNGVKEKMSNVKDAVKKGWDNTMEFLSGINLFDIGKNIIDGMIGGITSMAGSLIDSAKGVVSGAIDGAKKLLGIKSPSRVFMAIGEFTGEGFIDGMKRMTRGVKSASERMTGAAVLSKKSPAFQGINTQTVPGARRTRDGINDSVRRNDESIVNAEVPLYVNGRELAKASAKDITKVQERKNRRDERFRG